MAELTALGKQSAAEQDQDDDGVNDLFDETTVEGVSVKTPLPPQPLPAAPSVEPLEESFLGAWMGSDARYKGLTTKELVRKQKTLQTLYETRCASLQRLVGFFVLFHAMGKAS